MAIVLLDYSVLLTFCCSYVLVSMSLNNASTIGGTTSITLHEGDDVEVFIERFDMAMRCGGVKEEKWTMKLLCSLSLDAYKRVKNESFPEQLEDITYVRVRETLVKIFRKTTNIYKCRYEFNQVKKAEGRTLIASSTDLKKLPENVSLRLVSCRAGC